MLEADVKTTIKTLYQKGYNKTQIGQMLDIDRKTVRKVLKESEAKTQVPEAEAVAASPKTGWPSMLDKYREYIEIQLPKGLSITRVHQNLQKEYDIECGYTTLRDYVAKYGSPNRMPTWRCTPCQAKKHRWITVISAP